jgi:hypothetical protein
VAPDADPDDATVRAAHEASIDAGLDVLRTELTLVHGNLDSIDRKAALLPPFLVALAGLLIPLGQLSDIQLLLIAGALLSGISAVGVVLWLVFPGEVYLGPNAHLTASTAHHAPVVYKMALAAELANSVRDTSTATVVKGRWLRRSMRLAGLTMLLLVVARVVGGVVAEETPAGQAPVPTSSPASTGEGSAEPSGSSGGASDSGGGGGDSPINPAPGTAIRLPKLGQQIAIKGGEVPKNIEAAIVQMGSEERFAGDG